VGLGGSWQTDPILHRLQEFADFLSLVRKAAKGAVDFLDIEYRDFTVTGSKIAVPVKEGRLVLFPAWLNHSVPVNVSDAKRVSISFNIMITDYTESMSPTLWEKGSAPIRKKHARPDP
jgi:ectoine hydroxylase-related dioxygenase (phytanoyl-CoA dioxygenase family)